MCIRDSFYTPNGWDYEYELMLDGSDIDLTKETEKIDGLSAVSYTHLRAHETVLDLVCRLLLAKTKN